MPFRESADRGGFITCPPEDVMEIVFIKRGGKSAFRAVKTHIPTSPTVTDGAVADAEHTADKGGAGRKTRRVRAIIIVEFDSVFCNTVNIGCGIPIIPIAPMYPAAAYQCQ